jgi:hypothetical protein
MKKLFIIISSSILLIAFSGCGAKPCVQPSFPTIKEIEPTKLIWEDIKWNGKKLHALTPHEWQHIQSELINAGMTANMCIQLIDSYNQKRIP